MNQKDIFLASEGDAWWRRNAAAVEKRKLPDEDPLLMEILRLPRPHDQPFRVLEIGCGDGSRLAWLKEHQNMACFGLEPSALAVAQANSRGITAWQGTADQIPSEDQQFDLIIYGFCLYLCDRSDLFRIASEADRCLKPASWILIQDFYNPNEVSNHYHHCAGVQSYKMNYPNLFTWHPDYQLMTQHIRHHETLAYTDEVNEWTSISVIRKHQHE